jgi:O-antigen/teichoic acid export membrane protein
VIAALRRLRPLLIGTGARLAAAGIGLVGTAVAARSLGPEAWGVWVLLFAGFGWAQHLSEWGLRNVALVTGGRTGSVTRILVLDILRARLLACGMASGGFVLAAHLLWPAAGWAPLWLTFALFAIALNLDWVALAVGDPVPAALGLVARPAIFLLALLCLPAPLDATDLALATCAGWAATAMVGMSNRPVLTTRRRGSERLGIARAIVQGTPFFLLTAANQLAQSLDLLVVAWVLGTAQAGAFALVATVAQAATLGAQAGAQWWLARAARAHDGELRRALLEAGLLGALVAAGLLAAGPPVVVHLFGPTWQAAADLLPAAALYVVAAHLTAVLGAWMSARQGASTVAGVQLGTQALVWPIQLLAAVHLGLPAVLLLRGMAELARAAMLAMLWRRRTDLRRLPAAA